MTPAKVMIILTSIAAAFFLLCVLITTIATAMEKSQAELVKFTKRVYSKRGIVRGFHVDYGSNRNELFFGFADIFLGIPFAQPPVGELRFKLPQPVHKYKREEGALAYKPKCAQANEFGQVAEGSSEDCLYLNVFTPNVSGKFPVIVNIHGGAFVTRGADDFHYKGAVRNFVSNGVVVVTIQYRLGPFGFFTTFTPDFPANLGLFDQTLALNWVKEDISAFGGDPNHVTLYGQSAGAISASGLSLSPLTRGLFDRLILNSGSVHVSFFVPGDPRGSIQQLRAAQWCNVTEDLMTTPTARAALTTCLANLTTEEIVKHDASLSLPGSLRWAPVWDGAIFPEDPEALARLRPPYDVLLMDMPVEQAIFDPVYKSGNVSNYGPHTLKSALLNRNYGYLSDSQLNSMVDILIANYKTSNLENDDHLGWFKLIMDIISAERYTNYGRLEAQWLKAHGSRTFLATFTYDKRICGVHSAINGYDPTTHYTDVCYIWFTPAEWERAARDGKLTARDLAVANNFARVYTQFTKNGTTGWSESGSDYQFVHFDESLDNVSSNWRSRDNYVFTEVLPPVIGANPPIKLTEDVESALKLNGEVVLKAWQRSLVSRPP